MKEALDVPASLAGRIWLCEPRGRHWARHHHDELELNLVIAGTGRYQVQDRLIELGPQDLLWLFPAQDHLLLDASPDYRMWILVIHPAALAGCQHPDHAALQLGDPPGHWCRRVGGAGARHLESLLRAVQALEPEGPEQESACYNAGLLHTTLLAWRLFARASAIEVLDLHPAVRRACRLLADGDLGLDELAARCGLSGSRLSHLVKEQLGMTLVRYRSRQRLERFLRRYRPSQERTMLADALAAGFGSYAQFHRVFSAELGCGPAEWYHS